MAETDITSLSEENKKIFQSQLETNLAPADALKNITSGAITSDTLSGNVTPINLPTPTPSTLAAGITGTSQAIIDQQNTNAKIEADRIAKTNETKAQQSKLSSIVETITGKQTERAAAEGDINTVGTPLWQKEQARQYALGLDKSQRAQLNEIASLETQNLTAQGSSAAQTGINRRYALEQGDIQLKYHIAASDYNAAEETLNKKFELELEPLKTQYNYQKTVYDDIKDSLTKAEDRQWTALLDQSKTALATATAEKTAIATDVSTLLKENPAFAQAHPDVITKMSNAGSRTEALGILANAGGSLQNPLDVQSKQIDIAYKQAEIDKIYADAKAAQADSGVVPGQKPIGKADPQSAAYATRTVNADKIITDIGNKFTGILSFGGFLPTRLQTDERIQYEQAKRNFVNAVLRKESGAAISPSEFSSAESQYFPQAGDDSTTIANKAINRIDAMNGLIGAAGKAYNGTYLPYPEVKNDNPFAASLGTGGSIYNPSTGIFNIPK